MKKYVLISDNQPTLSVINFKQELNLQQYDVVTGAEGPCLVLAGAGSGKTRTLIYRVAYLLEKGISPSNILLVTFTNKAAQEMKDRIQVIMKKCPTGLICGTFHHVGNLSIRMYAENIGYTKSFGILDEEDSKNLIKLCLQNVAKQHAAPSVSLIREVISFSINSKKNIENAIYDNFPHLIDSIELIKKTNLFYQKKKKQINSLDYDDLLTEWLNILHNVPEARDKFASKFRYILVDEYQDTNKIQFDIIKQLSYKHKNILVVGDDAQSIYSFRAAEIRNILDFPKHFPDTKIFKLEHNYRSTPEILNLANESIKNNNEQFPKTLRNIRENGELPVLVKTKDPYEQASFVVQRIFELQEEGVSLSDIVVLFRAHYQSAELEMELVKKQIPYIIRGGIRFFEQAHIKDILAHMKILANHKDEVAWLRALTLYPGIGEVTADKIFNTYLSSSEGIQYIFTDGMNSHFAKKSKQGFEKFQSVIKKILLEKKPDEVIKAILENIYKEYIFLNFDNAQDRYDDIIELINFAHTYENISSFLNDVSLRENFRGETVLDSSQKSTEVVVLSTIHQAKGLEWNTVMLVGLIEGQFPHPKALLNSESVEEERRLFYVAATRAKTRLIFVQPITRYDYKMGTVICRPSRFVDELPDYCYEKMQVESCQKDEDDIFYDYLDI